MLGRLERIPRMGGGLQGRLPFPSVYRYAMPPPTAMIVGVESSENILPDRGQQRRYVEIRCRLHTSKTPHFLSVSSSLPRSDLKFALTELSTAPSTFPTDSWRLVPERTTAPGTSILSHYRTGR